MIDRLIIGLAILLMVGNNYAFDIPQALEIPIEKEFKLTQTQFNLLYSIFAVPNIGLSIGGGIMIDRMGGRWGVFTFSLMLGLSQLFIAFGGCYQKYYMMLVGRAIFGIASDLLHIAVFKVIARRMPHCLGTAMGLILTVPELAAALNSFLSPYLFEKTHSLEWPLLFGLSLCILSFLSGLLMIYLDTKYDTCSAEEPDEEVSLSKFKLSKPFVRMSLITTLMLAAYVPFLDNANKFYHERFGFSIMHAGRIVTVGYIVAALSSPIIGKISDTFSHKRQVLIVASTLMFFLSHLQLYYMPHSTHPNYMSVFALITLGLSYACYSSILMPALQSTVPDNMLATALGILGIIENICMATVPMLSGFVYTFLKGEKDRMRDVDIIYLVLAGIGVCLSIGALPNQGKHIKHQKDAIKQLHQQPEENNNLI
ncbi:unnamed protein product [Paramecium octaurelia]|uniref:Major facilitator superfamily (MFS) profile domain-containing protein n=1 Tax=Paramecium octaurelia TaxID=43137 RepID=A0A8S1T3Z7_PAROT|nr:unnamed protein product [Paramecium octaurelia]